MRHQLCVAFREKVKEWARTVPPEFIALPPTPARRHRQEKTLTHDSEEEEDDDNVHDEEDDEEEDYHRHEYEDDDTHDDHDDEGDDDDDRTQERGQCHDDGHDDGHNEGNYDDKAQERMKGHVHQDDGHGTVDDDSYYFTEHAGKIKYRRLEILAPKDEIYQKLSEGGLVSSRLKKPLPVLKLVKKSDAEIVGWYYYCSIELLQYFRICHNLKEVKAIVEYHIRWSAIRTLAKKYRCNEREIVRKYGRDLECEDKKGNKVRLMTREEIKQLARGVNKRVQITHRFGALKVLADME